MRTLKLLGSMCLVVLLQACASMGKDQCQNADWRTIGYEDGAHGLSPEAIGQHRRDCAKYGVTPDLNAYLSGRNEGLREFCKPDNGFQVGQSGRGYSGVCPKDLEAAFLDAYQTGHQLYALRSALSHVDAQLNARERELSSVKHRIIEKSALLVDEKTTTKERIDLLSDINDLNNRKDRLRHEIANLRQARAANAADLDAFQRSLAGG